MSKVLLVEDDNNLREIFEMRLQAEGFDTVTAGDGEEGLVVAMREKPDLIIADVMMPKLSGFEMVESLKAAPETSNIKVIMMTALGQAEDQARGQKLAVVKYLVKSQVTLEDFVRVVRDALQPGTNSGAANSLINNSEESENKMPDDNTTPTNPMTPPAGDSTSGDSSAPATNPISGDPNAGGVADSGQMSSAEQQSTVNDQVSSFVQSTPATPPVGDTSSDSAAPDAAGSVPVTPPPTGDPASPAPPADGQPPA